MELIVESFEGDIYLAYQVKGSNRHLLADENHQPIRFHSLNQIKDYCASQDYISATLLHVSPYDEMCGSSAETYKPMAIDLKWF